MKTLLLLLTLVFTLPCPSFSAKDGAPMVDSVEQTTKRAESLVLPRVEFREALPSEAAAYLAKTSKEIDPDKIGVAIELSPAALAKSKETRITISLSNVPLLEVVKYVTHLANLKYRIAKSKIVVTTMEGK